MTVVDVAEQSATPPEPPTLGALQSTNNETTPPPSGGLPTTTGSESKPQLTPASQGITSVVQASGIIRIIFKRP